MLHSVAYFDITATTAVISAVAGVAVAVGAVIIVWIRKARKKINDKLGLEERQKKEVEDDVVITTASEKKDN